MFFELTNENETLENVAVAPEIIAYDHMVYLALSEFFFDSGMSAYYKAGIFQMHIANDRMPKDMEMMLRTTYFATIMLLNPALMEAPLSLRLEVTAPPKTSIRTSGATVAMAAVVTVMLLPPGQPAVQLSSMTMRGVRIPLADGMDFVEEVVEYHNGYIVIGANLRFSRGLRDMIQTSLQ
ncbi:hypothetical protein CRUP_032238 [Coryphaenoides rupestris]|nr:hypothetical protein CRUP_032238 [Coryphaenoides rupestris]